MKHGVDGRELISYDYRELADEGVLFYERKTADGKIETRRVTRSERRS